MWSVRSKPRPIRSTQTAPFSVALETLGGGRRMTSSFRTSWMGYISNDRAGKQSKQALFRVRRRLFDPIDAAY
jgi:hypothetical protein